MARSRNALLAAGLFDQMRKEGNWSKAEAWKGIAKLLLSCEIYGNQVTGWLPFHGVVVYRESNDFKRLPDGQPNSYLRKGESLTQYLADELGVPRSELCATIAQYWRQPGLTHIQPHNLVGHAFRSICTDFLTAYGDPDLTYEEEVDPRRLYPGFIFQTRSKDPRIDIVGFRNGIPVALISSRWRYRHDRVDVVEEALAYAPAARRFCPGCHLYGLVGEFSRPRLLKILENCPPMHPNPALDACVHFNPNLIFNGLGENGHLVNLKSLEWLADQTWHWK